MSWLLVVLSVIVGIYIGSNIEKDRMSFRNVSGRLRIDRSDDVPYIFLEIDGSLEKIISSKTVLLEVVLKDYLPRK